MYDKLIAYNNRHFRKALFVLEKNEHLKRANGENICMCHYQHPTLLNTSQLCILKPILLLEILI